MINRRSTPDITDLLRAEPGDPGCDFDAPLEQFVELELAGQDPAARYPGTATHLRACPACRADHDGLLELTRALGDAAPPST